MKNILISTGGSGGHVVPATIIYDHLKEKSNVMITIDNRGLDYLDTKLYNPKLIDTPRLNNIFLLPLNFFIVLFLVLKSIILLKKNKIETLISTGGYMSLPLILASKILKLKIYLFEPNLVLGRANRFFLKSSNKIFCYTKEIKNFPQEFRSKIEIINPLVRKEIYDLDLSIKNNKKFHLLIVGGSQGAKIFDKNLESSIIAIAKKFPIKIFQQSAKKNINYFKDLYDNNNIENVIFSFHKNFPKILSEIDLCITRSGASTLAELSVLKIPFITVPLLTSMDNHQFENAYYYEKNDCCWIIEQNSLEEKIEGILIDILKDRTDYLRKRENLKKLNYQNTWNNVNQKILKVINEN